MFAHNFILILNSVVISIILCIIIKADEVISSRCAEIHIECDLQNLQPCCNPMHSCRFNLSRKKFVCQKEVKIDSSCVSSEDCFEIARSECSSENKCVCKENYLKFNETHCTSKLGGFCWMEEPCASKKALCVDSKCQCKNYYSASEGQCLPVLEGLQCIDDRDCAQIRYAKCSDSSVCVCSLNTALINNTSCEPVLDDYCETDNDCPVSNSICKNYKCHCRQKYLSINGNQCVEARLGMSCTDDFSCNSYMKNTICSPEKNCICSQDSYYYNKSLHSLLYKMSYPNYEECRAQQSFCLYNKCYHYSIAGFADAFCSEDDNCVGSLLGELCDIDDDCLPYNSICSGKRCKCEMKYRADLVFSCVLITLNQKCTINSHCSEIPNAECSDYECKCKAGYGKSSAITCSPLLGTQCTNHDECVVPDSMCFDKKCKCSDYFMQQSNDLCRSTIIHQTCKTNLDCESIKYSNCSSYNLCYCTKNSISLSGTACGALVNQYCSNDLPCVAEYSVCVNNTCECIPSSKKSNTECIKIGLGESCDSDRDCTMTKYAKCSSRKTCSCLTNYVSINNTLCSPLLDKRCQGDDECYVNDSQCIANKCRCKDDFVAVDSNSRCESSMLGKQCNTSEDCSRIKNSICSPDKVCICPPKYFAANNHSCTPTINATCFNDIQCSNDLFRCVDGKCQCKSGYTAVSVNRCMKTSLMSSCKKNYECSDTWHWYCTTNGKCVCNVDNISINDFTCLPSLNGYCWKDDQCVVKNSICTDYRCQCKPHFVAVANNHCVFKVK